MMSKSRYILQELNKITLGGFQQLCNWVGKLERAAKEAHVIMFPAVICIAQITAKKKLLKLIIENLLIKSLTNPLWKYFQHTFTSQAVRAREVIFGENFHMSHVMCHMSHVKCHMSHAMCLFFYFPFFYKVLKLFIGGSVINGAYRDQLVSVQTSDPSSQTIKP